MLAVLEKIEKEGIQIEPKQLNDAKNVLNKLKWANYYHADLLAIIFYSVRQVLPTSPVHPMDQSLDWFRVMGDQVHSLNISTNSTSLYHVTLLKIIQPPEIIFFYF